MWLALNTVILFLLVGLFELIHRYAQKTGIHKYEIDDLKSTLSNQILKQEHSCNHFCNQQNLF